MHIHGAESKNWLPVKGSLLKAVHLGQLVVIAYMFVSLQIIVRAICDLQEKSVLI